MTRLAVLFLLLLFVTQARAQDAEPDEEPVFEVRALVTAPEPSYTPVEGDEARDTPGALGDPFRIIETLPGVVPTYTGVPYVYVRGAPPSGTRYFFAGVPLPQLFHAALGPSVIHPRLIGGMEMHSGVAPASYGGHLGAVVVSELAEGRDAPVAEVDVRLLDVTGYIDRPLPGGGRLVAAARFGYPRLVLLAISPETKLWYGDYQLFYTTPLSSRLRVEVVALGSYDYVQGALGVSGDFGVGLALPPDFAMQLGFHRFETRLVHETGRGEVGVGLRLGYDHSDLETELAVSTAQVTPRLWWEHAPHRMLRLRGTAELSGHYIALDDSPGAATPATNLIDLPDSAQIPVRSTASVSLDARVTPWRPLIIDAGVRADLWMDGGRQALTADPRLRLTFLLGEHVDLTAALGLAHQPALFFIPLPGLERVRVGPDMQRVAQSELGIGVRLPGDVRVELEGYVHRYRDAVLNQNPAYVSATTVADVSSLGGELFVRRDRGRYVTGFLSYGLGRSRAETPDGVRFTPLFDVRHVINLVTQLRVVKGLTIGGRFHARSGQLVNEEPNALRPSGQQVRLPWFPRFDARVGYEWQPAWGVAQVYLDWLNASLTAEPVAAECLFGTCRVVHGATVTLPSVGFRAEL